MVVCGGAGGCVWWWWMDVVDVACGDGSCM